MKSKDSYFKYDDECSAFGITVFDTDIPAMAGSPMLASITLIVPEVKVKARWHQLIWLFIKDWFTAGPIYDT